MQAIECLSKRNAKKVLEHKKSIETLLERYVDNTELSNDWDFEWGYDAEEEIEELDKILSTTLEEGVEKGKEKLSDWEHKLYEKNIDFISELEHSAVEYFLEDPHNIENILEAVEHGADIELTSDEWECLRENIEEVMKFFDMYEYMLETVSEHMSFNPLKLFNYPVLLKLKPAEEFCSECGEDDDIEYYMFIRELSRKYGIEIPKKIATTVYVNSFNESTFGLAIIVNGDELIDFILGNEDELEGDAILYGHDSWSGSGDYEYLAETITIRSKEDILGIDYGSYSLGDIFGSVEWIY